MIKYIQMNKLEIAKSIFWLPLKAFGGTWRFLTQFRAKNRLQTTMDKMDALSGDANSGVKKLSSRKTDTHEVQRYQVSLDAELPFKYSGQSKVFVSVKPRNVLTSNYWWDEFRVRRTGIAAPDSHGFVHISKELPIIEKMKVRVAHLSQNPIIKPIFTATAAISKGANNTFAGMFNGFSHKTAHKGNHIARKSQHARTHKPAASKS